jgi:hypothetical protein
LPSASPPHVRSVVQCVFVANVSLPTASNFSILPNLGMRKTQFFDARQTTRYVLKSFCPFNFGDRVMLRRQ